MAFCGSSQEPSCLICSQSHISVCAVVVTIIVESDEVCVSVTVICILCFMSATILWYFWPSCHLVLASNLQLDWNTQVLLFIKAVYVEPKSTHRIWCKVAALVQDEQLLGQVPLSHPRECLSWPSGMWELGHCSVSTRLVWHCCSFRHWWAHFGWDGNI